MEFEKHNVRLCLVGSVINLWTFMYFVTFKFVFSGLNQLTSYVWLTGWRIDLSVPLALVPWIDLGLLLRLHWNWAPLPLWFTSNQLWCYNRIYQITSKYYLYRTILNFLINLCGKQTGNETRNVYLTCGDRPRKIFVRMENGDGFGKHFSC